MATYGKETTEKLLRSVEQAVGIHVLCILAENAVYNAKQKYEEAVLIECSEQRISLDKLDSLPPEKADLILQEFVICITSSLANLVGKKMAMQLLDQLQQHNRAEE